MSIVTDEQIADIRQQVLEHVTMPDTAQLRKLARRRARLRLGCAVAGVAAFAVVASSGVYVVRSHQPQVPPVVAVQGPLPAAVVPLAAAGRLLAMSPWDADTAYAFYEAAQGKSVLAYTGDRGRTWTAHQVPTSTPADVDALVVGPLSVVVHDVITKDGGKTWAKAGADEFGRPSWPRYPLIGKEIPAAPDGWVVAKWPMAGAAPNRPPTVMVAAVNPATGTYRPLAAQPKAPDGDTGQVYRADGRALWMVSLQGQNLWGVHISTDGGKSWTNAEVSSPNVGGLTTHFATNGQTVYLTPGPQSVRTGGDADASGKVPLAMRVSTDRGRTWSAPYLPAGISDVGAMFVLSDGSLIATGRTAVGWSVVRSTDEGRSFERMGGAPVGSKPGLLSRTGSGVYAFEAEGQTYVSADGRDWRRLAAPQVK